jgi:NAD(P)-dependent dehydrogenase (short-subunit alcohol dehydrogenase family)
MEQYQGKKVVIIGGTSGMGLATAKMLLDGGARVLVTGRSKEGLESAQKELGNDAIVVSSDARSLTDLDALAARVKAEFDTFDLLFVNAGFSIRAPLESITEAVYDEMFNLNAKGPLFAVQKLAPLINRGGRCRPHDFDRQRQGNARQRHIRSRQGCAAIIRPGARRRAASSRDSSQRGDARPHRHANLGQDVPRERRGRPA